MGDGNRIHVWGMGKSGRGMEVTIYTFFSELLKWFLNVAIKLET